MSKLVTWSNRDEEGEFIFAAKVSPPSPSYDLKVRNNGVDIIMVSLLSLKIFRQLLNEAE